MRAYLKKNRTSVIINISLICFTSLIQVATAICLTFSTNSVLNLDFQKFIFFITINLVLWIILIISNRMQMIYETKLIQHISNQMRDNIVDGLVNAQYKDAHSHSIGGYLSKLTNDISSLESLAFKNFFSLFSNLTAILFSAIALYFYNISLLIIVVLMLVIMTIVPKYFSKNIEKVTNNLSKTNSMYTERIKDYLSGFDVFYSLNKRTTFRNLSQIAQSELSNSKIDFAKENANVQSKMMFLNIFSQMIIDFFTGILAIQGYVQLGAISTTGNLASTIFNSFSQVSTQYIQLKATTELFTQFNSSSDDKTPDKLADFPFSFERQIRIENLSYSINNKKILNNLNLIIEKNKKYILLGESGSGKSTLLKILSGQITNYQGNIFIDEINLKDITNQHLVDNIQYVDQDVYVFNTSIKNNLTMWDSLVPGDTDLQNLIDEYKLNFFENVEDVVTENGNNLSGGQKQRLALARSLIIHKDILFMDESTSSLDKKTAAFIERNLINKPDRTIIMVTHKISEQIQNKFDNVFQLEDLQVITDN